MVFNLLLKHLDLVPSGYKIALHIVKAVSRFQHLTVLPVKHILLVLEFTQELCMGSLHLINLSSVLFSKHGHLML